VLTELPGWVTEARFYARVAAHQNIIKTAVQVYDLRSLHNAHETAKDSAYAIAANLYERNFNAGKHSNLLKVSLASSGKRVFGNIDGAPHMIAGFKANSRLRDYTYCDITGRPKNVSEAKWKQRRDDWHGSVINDYHAKMLEYTVCHAEEMVLPTGNELCRIPTYEARLHQLVEQRTMQKCIEELGIENEADYTRFLMSNPKYTEVRDAVQAELEAVLDKNLTTQKLQKEV
jgi:hypothetical protein